MNFDKVKGLVGSLAPTLGAALGGPVGGAAASMLADASNARTVSGNQKS